MPEISVIIPVYQVQQYLRRCVDSVLKQSYKDYEILLIDDGSTDGSAEICDAYAKKEERVKAIHKQNGGLSDARNVGLEAASGNYVTFLDSDDYIHPRMLEMLHKGAVRFDSAVSLCKFVKTDGEPFNETLEIAAPERWETEQYYLHDSMNATIACAKLYKRECFENIRYPVGKVHEDEFTTYKILFQYPFIVVTETPLYGYFRNNDGITRSTWTPKRMMAFEAFEQQLEYFRELNRPAVIKDRYGNYLWTITKQMQLMQEENQMVYFYPTRKRLRRVLRQYRSECNAAYIECAKRYESAYPLFKSLIRLRVRLELKLKQLFSKDAH